MTRDCEWAEEDAEIDQAEGTQQQATNRTDKEINSEEGRKEGKKQSKLPPTFTDPESALLQQFRRGHLLTPAIPLSARKHASKY